MESQTQFLQSDHLIDPNKDERIILPLHLKKNPSFTLSRPKRWIHHLFIKQTLISQLQLQFVHHYADILYSQ